MLLSWLGVAVLHDLIVLPAQLGAVMDCFPEADRLAFLKLLSEKNLFNFKSIFLNTTPPVSGVSLVAKIAKAQRIEFLRFFKTTIFDRAQALPGFSNLNQLVTVLTELLNLEHRFDYVTNLLGQEGVNIKTELELFSLLAVIPVAQWADFLTWLGKDKIKNCVQSANHVANLLNKMRFNASYVGEGKDKEAAISLIVSYCIENYQRLVQLLSIKVDPVNRLRFLKLIGFDNFVKIVTQEQQLNEFLDAFSSDDMQHFADSVASDFLISCLRHEGLATAGFLRVVKSLDGDQRLKFFSFCRQLNMLNIFIKKTDNFFQILEEFTTLNEKLRFMYMVGVVKIQQMVTDTITLNRLMIALRTHVVEPNDYEMARTIKQYVKPAILEKTLKSAPINDRTRIKLIERIHSFINQTSSWKDSVPFFGRVVQQVNFANGLIDFIQQRGLYQQVLEQIDSQIAVNLTLPYTEQSMSYRYCLDDLKNILRMVEDRTLMEVSKKGPR